MPRKRKRANGEGTVYKRADGMWVAQITFEDSRPTFYGRTQKEVIAKMEEAKVNRIKGTLVKVNEITVEEWLDRWINLYQKNKIKENTRWSYMSIIKNHIKPAIGDIKLQKLTPDDIQLLYNNKRDSGLTKTVILMHTILYGALTQAVKNRLIMINPADAVNSPEYKTKKRNALDAYEWKKFLELAQQNRYYVAILLIATSGIRRGENLGLHWSSVKFDKNIICIKDSLITEYNPIDRKTITLLQESVKTETSERIIPVLPFVMKQVQKHKEEQEREKQKLGYDNHDLVFCTTKGTPINPRNFNRTLAQIKKKAGIEKPVSPHILRHSFATRLIEQGVHPKVVQELLGHRSIDTAMDIYTDVFFDIKTQAIATLGNILGLPSENETPEN